MSDSKIKTMYQVIECGFDDETEILQKELICANGEIAAAMTLDELTRNEDKFDIPVPFEKADILLIKMLSNNEDVLSVARKIYENNIANSIDIILYAPDADNDLVEACTEFKIFTVLVEPMPVKSIVSVVQSVFMSMGLVNKLKKEVVERSSAIGCIRAGHFEVRTLKEAYNLATMLAVTSPDPKTLSSGLFELISNGIEHGNLEIGYEYKTELLKSNQYYVEIDRRLASERYGKKTVTVLFWRDDDKIKVTIVDQGTGFNPAPYMYFDAKRLLDPHGRGIAMTVAGGFSSVKYNEIGNEVTCELKIA